MGIQRREIVLIHVDTSPEGLLKKGATGAVILENSALNPKLNYPSNLISVRINLGFKHLGNDILLT